MAAGFLRLAMCVRAIDLGRPTAAARAHDASRHAAYGSEWVLGAWMRRAESARGWGRCPTCVCARTLGRSPEGWPCVGAVRRARQLRATGDADGDEHDADELDGGEVRSHAHSRA